MSENKEELQSLIADLRAKLGDDAHVEVIDLDTLPPGADEEQQREPGPTLPDETLAMLAQAVIELPGRHIFRRSPGYHPWYLLDKRGEPVPAGDTWMDEVEVERLLCNIKKRTVKKTFLTFRRATVEISTVFLVHNHSHATDGPPILYETMLFVTNDKDRALSEFDGEQWRYPSKREARQGHRRVVDIMRMLLGRTHRLRRPSPRRRKVAQRRLAAGQDVLRRKPQKESAEHWFKRVLYEAFGDADGPEIAQALGLPPMPRKRGRQ